MRPVDPQTGALHHDSDDDLLKYFPTKTCPRAPQCIEIHPRPAEKPPHRESISPTMSYPLTSFLLSSAAVWVLPQQPVVSAGATAGANVFGLALTRASE